MTIAPDIRTLQEMAAAFAAGASDAPLLHVVASHAGGIRRVHVGLTARPVHLALTGHEAVSWQVDCEPFARLERIYVMGRQGGTVRRGLIGVEIVNLDPLGFGTPHSIGAYVTPAAEHAAFLAFIAERTGLQPASFEGDVARETPFVIGQASRRADPARPTVPGLAIAVATRRAA